MALVTGVTKNRNWHIIVEIYNDVTFVVKLLITKKVFKKTLGYSSRDNVKSINTDIF